MAQNIKVMALILSGSMLMGGITWELLVRQADAKQAAESALIEMPTVPTLAYGHPYCVTEGLMRMYDRALTDNREDVAKSMVGRQVCSIIDHIYPYEILTDQGEYVEVRVRLDDEEYEFWVSAETLR